MLGSRRKRTNLHEKYDHPNAALVEESAAAAESLKKQALQLRDAVAVFKLTQIAATG